MKRWAPDGEAYDLFDFEVWYEGSLARERWREAPPLDEVQDECDIAADSGLDCNLNGVLDACEDMSIYDDCDDKYNYN